MGKNYQGINGNWSGKIGPTVGRMSKGRTISAIYQPIVRNPRTPKQLFVRAKFALALRVFDGMSYWAEVMCKGLTKYGNTWSNFLHLVMAPGNIAGTTPENIEYRFDVVKLSVGNLMGFVSPDAAIDSHMLTVSWSDNSGSGNAQAGDQVCLAVYNSVKDAWLYAFNAGDRGSRQASMNLPTLWSGDSIDVWASATSPDGEIVMTSVYLGNFSI